MKVFRVLTPMGPVRIQAENAHFDDLMHVFKVDGKAVARFRQESVYGWFEESAEAPLPMPSNLQGAPGAGNLQQ